MEQLWIVTVQDEVVVLAESAEGAMRLAKKARRDGTLNPEPESAAPMTYMPGDWDSDCLPYGNGSDADSIGVLIKDGRAPKYLGKR